MKAKTLEALLRGGKVKRYHTMPISGEQTVAAHTYNVIAVLMYITEGKASRDMILEALSHDTPEWRLGDIPFGQKSAQYEAQERAFKEEWEIPTYELTAEELLIVKEADVLEMGIFGSWQVDLGNRAGAEIMANVLRYFNGKQVEPPTGVFLEALEKHLEEFINEG
ncbi:hypothetical protein N9937_01305 [bacterium]|nr:hypothetical protein [bacterium]